MCYFSTYFAQKYRENTKEVGIYKNTTWAIVYCRGYYMLGELQVESAHQKLDLFLRVSALLSPAHRNFHFFRRGVKAYYTLFPDENAARCAAAFCILANANKTQHSSTTLPRELLAICAPLYVP